MHVPYRSVPPALNDVLGGRVSMMFADLTTGMPHVKANALRALAVTRMQRSKLVPELPTLHEAGVANFDMDLAAMFAPANTPPEIVTGSTASCARSSTTPRSKRRWPPWASRRSSSPQELGDFVKDQLVKWTKMIKDAGIEPE